MRNLLDINTFANWVAMLRADIDGAIVLVDADQEGQFYEKCIHQTARVVPSPNTAIQLLQQVQARRVTGVIAVVAGAPQGEHATDAVFQPALGDAASILLASTSSERVMEEVGGTIWLRACAKEVGSIVDRAVLLASSIQEASSAGGELADIEELINWTTLTLTSRNGQSQPVEFATANSGMTDRRSLLTKFDGMLAIEILAHCTRRFQPRGLSSARQCTGADLLSMMRLSFDIAELEADSMFWQMRKWERVNDRYHLLRQWRLLDPLQVVLDQRYWEQDLRAMLQGCQPDAGTVALKLDLDNFKLVNEKLGHSAGDAAIRLACSVTKEVFGSVGEVYRRGGDEIVAISPGLEYEVAVRLAEQLRQTIERNFSHWGSERGLESTPTASIGLIYAASGSKIDEVTALLDEAQNSAKQQGKNRVVTRLCPIH